MLIHVVSEFNYFRKFPEVLKILFEIINREKNLRVIDNICAATCRMILASEKHVPLDVVSMDFAVKTTMVPRKTVIGA